MAREWYSFDMFDGTVAPASGGVGSITEMLQRDFLRHLDARRMPVGWVRRRAQLLPCDVEFASSMIAGSFTPRHDAVRRKSRRARSRLLHADGSA